MVVLQPALWIVGAAFVALLVLLAAFFQRQLIYLPHAVTSSPPSDVEEDTLAYLGESIRTGIAIGLTTRALPAALVLRSPFPELADVGRTAYPFLSVRTLRANAPVTEDLASYDAPILVVAGATDRFVTIPHAVSRGT